VDLDGHVLETGWANVWLVEGERLLTPPADGRLLAGVTREAILRQPALNAAEGALTLERVRQAGQLLLTSSIRLVTVGSLDGREPTAELFAVADRLRDLLRR
jgi:branched-subunit amino acid aminotransferase/4-amino-4-deoxychorismate lyase